MDPGTTDPDATGSRISLIPLPRRTGAKPNATLDTDRRAARRVLQRNKTSVYPPLDVEDDPTEFTKSVREEMAQISPGDVLTYGELAEAAGRPRAAPQSDQYAEQTPFSSFPATGSWQLGVLGGYGRARGLVLKQHYSKGKASPFTANGKVDFQELGCRQ